MGGYGSGQHGGKRKTAAQKRIEIMWMKRQGWLKEGLTGSLNWTCRGEAAGNIRYRVAGNALILNYRFQKGDDDWKPVEINIVLEYTPCNFGGSRAWMRCPSCNRRCGVLYLADELPACRKCYNLGYDSESETEVDRAMRQARKAQERLGYHEGDLCGWLPRPKGMHHTTYWKLLRKIQHGNAIFDAEVKRLFNRCGEDSF